MNEIDLKKTRNGKWLILKEGAIVIVVQILFRISVRAILPLAFSGFLLAYLISDDVNKGWSLCFVFSATLLVCIYEAIMDFRLREVHLDRPEELGDKMKEYFKSRGWWVRNNNKQFFYATKWMGKGENHFYMVYGEKSVYVCPVYEWPFPISSYLANRDLRYVRRISKF